MMLVVTAFQRKISKTGRYTNVVCCEVKILHSAQNSGPSAAPNSFKAERGSACFLSFFLSCPSFPCFVAWRPEFGLGTLNLRFIARPLKLGLGTLNPRFVAWPLESGLGTRNPWFVAFPLGLGLGTLNPRFVVRPLELGLGTRNPRFVAWPLKFRLGTLNPRFVVWPLITGSQAKSDA